MSMDRRTLLKGLAVAGAGAALAARPAEASERPQAPADAVGLLYDATRCIGCRACVTACKQANDLPYELYDPPQDLDGYTKNIIKLYEGDGERSYVKAQCMHCIDPACTNACMIGALAKREHGIVTWEPGRCIGCRYCQVACPYQVPKFQWGSNNPKIVKCELCRHILAKGGQPGCCEACPVGAVVFGTYEDLLADARARIERYPDRYWPAGDPQIFGDTEGGGTQVLCLAGLDFTKLGLPDLGDEAVGHLPRTVQHGVYKGMIAPIALYAILGGVLWRNRRAAKKEGGE